MSFWTTMFAFSTAATPEGAEGRYAAGFTLLRVGGWLVAATYVIGILSSVLINPLIAQQIENSDAPGGFGGLFVAATIFGIIFSTLVTGALLFWIGWTMEAWDARQKSGLMSAKILGIAGTVVFALGALTFLVVLAFGASMGPSFSDDGTTTSFNTGFISAPFTVAKLVVAAMLIANTHNQETAAAFEA